MTDREMHGTPTADRGRLTLRRLALRGLCYHWRMHITVALGVALACAILSGSLIVGDSVKATLRSLAEERLGEWSRVLAVDRFFGHSLAARVGSSSHYPKNRPPPVQRK